MVIYHFESMERHLTMILRGNFARTVHVLLALLLLSKYPMCQKLSWSL